jgi:hypothetical protein
MHAGGHFGILSWLKNFGNPFVIKAEKSSI